MAVLAGAGALEGEEEDGLCPGVAGAEEAGLAGR
jgi:hypothetical protein